jgi:hypothetical protein
MFDFSHFHNFNQYFNYLTQKLSLRLVFHKNCTPNTIAELIGGVLKLKSSHNKPLSQKIILLPSDFELF